MNDDSILVLSHNYPSTSVVEMGKTRGMLLKWRRVMLTSLITFASYKHITTIPALRNGKWRKRFSRMISSAEALSKHGID